MSNLPSPETGDAIVRATRDVFTTMLGLQVVPGEMRDEVPEAPSRDGIVAFVGIAWPWSGTGQLCCSARLACRMASAMFTTEYPAVNEDVLEALAEVTNM